MQFAEISDVECDKRRKVKAKKNLMFWGLSN